MTVTKTGRQFVAPLQFQSLLVIHHRSGKNLSSLKKAASPQSRRKTRLGCTRWASTLPVQASQLIIACTSSAGQQAWYRSHITMQADTNCFTWLQGFVDGILLTSAQLDDGIKRMAAKLARDYAGRCPHLLCILNGASVFAMKLYSALHTAMAAEASQPATVPFTCGFVKLSSYEGTCSTGGVGIGPLDAQPIRGRDVIVVEDIVDTGRSMSKLLPLLRNEHGANTACVCTLLEKRLAAGCALRARYCGFSIPDAFVVGFGLDLDEAFRDMPSVGVINEAGIAKFKGFGSTLCPPQAGAAAASAKASDA